MSGRGRGWLLALVVVTAGVLVPSSALAAPRTHVSIKAPARAPVGALIKLSGRLTPHREGTSVAVQSLLAKRWTTVARGRTGRRSSYVVGMRVPNVSTLRLRVAVLLGHRRTASRVVKVLVGASPQVAWPSTAASTSPQPRVVPTPAPPAAPSTVPPAPAAPAPGGPTTATGHTVVPDPRTVSQAPAPGQAGQLTLAGTSDVSVGDVVAIGIGPNTPYGFLGRVQAKQSSPGGTVLSTVPATLPEAVPEADVDQTLSLGSASASDASGARRAMRLSSDQSIDCGGKHLDARTSLELTPTMRFQASWSVLHGVSSASLTFGGRAVAKMSVSAKAPIASCSYSRTFIKRMLQPIDFQIGPVPVVIVPHLDVDLKINGSVGSTLTSSVSGTVQLAGGARWERDGGLRPTGSLDADFSAQPPSVDQAAHLGAHLVPSVEALFYGGAGPALKLETGLDFDASLSANPWWTIKAPLTPEVAFVIDILGLKVDGTVHLPGHTFTLLRASGPFVGANSGGGGGGTGGGGTGGGSSGGGGSDAPSTPVGQVAIGRYHACVIRKLGQVWCWGDNSHGELGDGTQEPESAPVQVHGVTDAVEVTAGDDFSCALRDTGTVMCWGEGFHGELGNGSDDMSLTPVTVLKVSGATQISSGLDNTCAVTDHESDVVCWGTGTSEYGTDMTEPMPTSFAEDYGDQLDHPVQVAVGYNWFYAEAHVHICALLASGHVECIDSNSNGQLGDGSTNDADWEFVEARGLADGTRVAAGQARSCAVRATGTVACWGYNAYGSLGDGTTIDRSTPTPVAALGSVVDVASGDTQTCAVGAAGGVWCWGAGTDPAPDTWGYHGESHVPATKLGISDATAVAVGSSLACATTRSGALLCWGGGVGLGPGDGSTDYTFEPVQVHFPD